MLKSSPRQRRMIMPCLLSSAICTPHKTADVLCPEASLVGKITQPFVGKIIQQLCSLAMPEMAGSLSSSNVKDRGT